MEEKKINGRKHVKLCCKQTKEYFWKDKSEYTRRVKENPKYEFFKDLKAKADFQGAKDELREFKYYLRYALKTSKTPSHENKGDFNLDAQFLKELWEKQKGICPYTGMKMNLKRTRDSRVFLRTASLDRVDSSRAYSKDNVEFVCVSVNYAKHTFSKQETLDFFNEIKTI